MTVVGFRHDADHRGPGVDQGLDQRVCGRGDPDPGGHPEGHQGRMTQRQPVGGLGEEGRIVGVGSWPAALDEGDSQVVQQPSDPELVVDRQP